MNDPVALLPAPPRAEVLSVTDLVADVRAGKIRIPEFQRNWKWKPEQVQKLFDSLYRGFPIGSLLMWRRPRATELLEIGQLSILAGERQDAWAVIDGQQRLWSLVGTLAHPGPRPGPDDPFAVWFDPENDAFRGGSGSSPLETWVPLPSLFDGPTLQEWTFNRKIFREQPELRQKVWDAGHRISSYRVPVYVVETDDAEIPRQIYERVNRGGTPMEEADVFNALVGRAGKKPSKLEDLQEEVKALGMGELRRHKLLQCVMALRGLDVTRRLDHASERRRLEGWLDEAAPAFRQALTFLRNEARIPHLRLLPYPVPLIVLTRFFHLWREPNARTRQLLRRWVWRGLLTAAHVHSDRTRLRAAVQAVDGNAEAAAQSLLELVPKRAPDEDWWLDARFDGRSAASRITGLGFAALEPRHLDSSGPIDVPNLIDSEEASAFRHLAHVAEGSESEELYWTAANRFLHPRGARRALFGSLARQREPEAVAILASHAIDEGAIEAVVADDWAPVLAARRDRLAIVVRELGGRLAEWGHSDRPSLDYLLHDDEAEAE